VTPAVPAAAVDALRRTVRGSVVYPADPAYAALVPAGRAPAAVVDASCEDDVVAAAAVASRYGLVLGDALLVLTGRLAAVTWDEAGVEVGAGVGWAALPGWAPPGSRGSVLDTVLDTVLAHPGGVEGSGARVVGLRVVGPDGFVRVVGSVAQLPVGGVVTAIRLALAAGSPGPALLPPPPSPPTASTTEDTPAGAAPGTTEGALP
jgi:hypothetical protein